MTTSFVSYRGAHAQDFQSVWADPGSSSLQGQGIRFHKVSFTMSCQARVEGYLYCQTTNVCETQENLAQRYVCNVCCIISVSTLRLSFSFKFLFSFYIFAENVAANVKRCKFGCECSNSQAVCPNINIL